MRAAFVLLEAKQYTALLALCVELVFKSAVVGAATAV